jgi:plastocyanin
MFRVILAFLAASGLAAAGCGDESPVASQDAAAAPGDAGPVADSGMPPRQDAAAMTAEAGRLDGGMADAKRDVASDTGPDSATPDVAVVDPATMMVGAAGGTLTLNEGKLFIPPGALASATTIGFRTVNSGFPSLPGGRAYSSVVMLEPHGQTFTNPARLTLYHFGGPAKVALYTAALNGTFTRIENATITVNTAEAPLAHFSYFVVAPAPTPVDASADARADTAVGIDATATDVAAPDVGADAAEAEVAPPPDAATPDAHADVAVDVAPDLTPPTDGAKTVTVKVRGELLSFDPKIAVIKVGDTVTWNWEGTGNHSVVSGGIGGVGTAACAKDGKFNSGVKTTGDSYSFTFTAAGSFGYHCAAHCTQFEGGSILVQP